MPALDHFRPTTGIAGSLIPFFVAPASFFLPSIVAKITTPVVAAARLKLACCHVACRTGSYPAAFRRRLALLFLASKSRLVFYVLLFHYTGTRMCCLHVTYYFFTVFRVKDFDDRTGNERQAASHSLFGLERCFSVTRLINSTLFFHRQH